MMPRTDAPSLGKFVARLVTGNPIAEDISPLAKKESKEGDPRPEPLDRSGTPKRGRGGKAKLLRK
jgi:hypothetical protein